MFILLVFFSVIKYNYGYNCDLSVLFYDLLICRVFHEIGIGETKSPHEADCVVAAEAIVSVVNNDKAQCDKDEQLTVYEQKENNIEQDETDVTSPCLASLPDTCQQKEQVHDANNPDIRSIVDSTKLTIERVDQGLQPLAQTLPELEYLSGNN